MSSACIDIPTLQINENELQNFLRFIYEHEELLKKFGAIKVQPNINCKLALKKRRKNLPLRSTTKEIVKINENQNIYFVQTVDHIKEAPEKHSMVTDECCFWSSLSSSSSKRRSLNISFSSNTSFFSAKTSRLYFDIHRIPNQSLFKLGGKKLTRQFVPCVKRAHGPGAIFPLVSTQQRLFLIDYHHEGGDHHWYIISTQAREALQNVIDQQKLPICLDHGQLFIDPSVLDQNHIPYHRVIQHPNEFIVLSAGTLAQSFTEGASWSESIPFALPSWIEDGHASVPVPACQCNIEKNYTVDKIDAALFRQGLIEKYITSYLQITSNDRSSALIGSLLC